MLANITQHNDQFTELKTGQSENLHHQQMLQIKHAKNIFEFLWGDKFIIRSRF